MSRFFLTIAIAAAVAMGCDSTDTLGGGGAGGAGGVGGGTIGPLTWVSSDLMIVPTDECAFFDETEALTFEMTIEGSTLTLVEPATGLEVSTDNYFDTASEVLVNGIAQDSTQDPCLVKLDDAMQLGLDNVDVSIDQNTTLSVTWTHVEEENSTDECDGVWLVPLPCSGQVNLTLTQSPAPE